MKKMMIIEDDPAILIGLEAAFDETEYDVITATDGLVGLHDIKKKKPDLIILDILLPGMNGMDLCRQLRREGFNTPVIMLTSKTTEDDKLKGFECGADDYVTKPFSVLELQARVKAQLKRATMYSPDNEKAEVPETIEIGNLHFNFKKLECRKNNVPVNLSVKEFEIIKYFFQHTGEVISREKLLDEIWGYENFPSTRTVDNYILNIRKALEDDPSNPKYFLTIHTLGYKFNY